MTSTSKSELRSPDGQITSAAGSWFAVAVMRCLWGGFVVVVVAALVVQWLHIDELRRRVSELEHTCQSADTDKHLFDDHQRSLSNNQVSAAEV